MRRAVLALSLIALVFLMFGHRVEAGTAAASSEPVPTLEIPSFTAPEENAEESGFPVVPVAAGGGLALARVAIVLGRLLPF